MGPIWYPFGALLDPMGQCGPLPIQARGPHRTIPDLFKPSQTIQFLYIPDPEYVDLRWMILDSIDRSIDLRSNTPISTFWGLNLESYWHPSDAVLGLDPFRDCGVLRMRCYAPVLGHSPPRMHSRWCVSPRTHLDPSKGSQKGSKIGPQTGHFGSFHR